MDDLPGENSVSQGSLRMWYRGTVRVLCLLLAGTSGCFAQAGPFRYFYDDANELFRVLDSTGTLIEYVYDANGNIAQVKRSTVPPSTLTILNVVPLSGSPSQTVTIYGQNFSSSAASDTVQFGGVGATVVSASSTALVVQIPAGISTGQITVTVNGVTANSGTLAFAPAPTITSLSPACGTIGQTVNGVAVQGINLFGATFSLSGGGTVTAVTVSNTQATLNITLGQNLGPFVLTATTDFGSSSSQPSVGNTFVVFNIPGSNYSDRLFSVFNATGATPFYPPGSNEADRLFSVFNPLIGPGTIPATPPGSNEADRFFSVFNPLISPGTASGIPTGSNEAWQLFSTQNQTGARSGPMVISLVPTARPIVTQSGPGQTFSGQALPGQALPGLTLPGQTVPGSRAPLSLIAGQSVQMVLRPSVFLYYLELDADKAPLASSTTGSLSLPLTAPFGPDSLDLRAFGYTSFGTTSDSLTETVRIGADPGRTITGQVIDASGSPVPGAVVTWQAQGLAAEYYQFGAKLSAIPDLRRGPARMSFLSALNYPNPQQVFGLDPMGVGLGGNYASRLSGKIELDAAGLYQFGLLAHQGARLTIDGQLVAEAQATGADAVTASGSVSLTAGAHDLEVTHFESGGAAALQLLWTPPGGVQAVVPPSSITSEAPVLWRVVTNSDGRFVLHVPAALDGVVVRLAAGVGSVQVDQ